MTDEIAQRYAKLPRVTVERSHVEHNGVRLHLRKTQPWHADHLGPPCWPDLSPLRPPSRSLLWVVTHPLAFLSEQAACWKLKAYDRRQRREMQARQRSIKWPDKFT